MRYTRPFTLVQRQEAAKTYRSFRAMYDAMRFRYPPINDNQRRLSRTYRGALHDFRALLAEKDAKVDVDRLNAVQALAENAAIDYLGLRNDVLGRFADVQSRPHDHD